MRISTDLDGRSTSSQEGCADKTSNSARVLHRKRTGKAVASFTVYMDPETLTALRHCAIDEGVTPSDLLVSVFQEYIDFRKNRGL